jgi:hypothetical protein
VSYADNLISRINESTALRKDIRKKDAEAAGEREKHDKIHAQLRDLEGAIKLNGDLMDMLSMIRTIPDTVGNVFINTTFPELIHFGSAPARSDVASRRSNELQNGLER